MVASTIVGPGAGHATRSRSAHASQDAPPRFIVQHTTPGQHRVVDVQASSTATSVVAEYTDPESARDERDRRNAQYWDLLEIDERLRRLPRQAHLLALFESAETQELMAQMLGAYQDGAMFRFVELVDEFDAAFTEAVAGA